MDFFYYLSDTFGVNEPIFSTDIRFEDYSKPWIAKQLASLCESGKLVRFERGIYYIPVNTPFGKSVLNPNKVIERKYIMDKGAAAQIDCDIFNRSHYVPKAECFLMRTVYLAKYSKKINEK